MTYEEFERVGLDCDVPYALIKLAWEASPYRFHPFNEKQVRVAMTAMLETCPPEAMSTLRSLSQQEIEPGALEEIGRSLRFPNPREGP